MNSKDIITHTNWDEVKDVAIQVEKLPIGIIYPFIGAIKELLQFGRGLYEYRISRLVKIILADVNKLSSDQWCKILEELKDAKKKERFGAILYDILIETRRQSDAEFFSFLLKKKVIGEITTEELIQMKNMTEGLNDLYSLKETVDLLSSYDEDNYSIPQGDGEKYYYWEIQELYRCGALLQAADPMILDGGSEYSPPTFSYSEIGKKYIDYLSIFLS